MKKLVVFAVVVVLIAGIALSPLGPYLLSNTVMKAHGYKEERTSLSAEKGIKLEIPSTKGWYPFVIAYNAGEQFREYTGEKDENLDLTIYYNFGQFDFGKGCSTLYDASSPYYSAFYGAYVVSGDKVFHEDGKLDVDGITQITKFDYTQLVLGGFNMAKAREVFQSEITKYEEGHHLAGYEDWYMTEAQLNLNGVAHGYKGYLRNYLQYGKPNFQTDSEFEPVNVTGRVYGRYFKEWDVGVCFYIMAKDIDLIEEWEEKIVSKTVIEAR